MVNIFWGRKHLLFSTMAWTQSTLKSVEIVLLTSKTFRSSPSLLWFTISLLNTTEQEIFVSSYFSFYLLHIEKPAWKQDTVQGSLPSKWYHVGSWETPWTAWRLRYKHVLTFLFLRQRLLLPGSTAASLQQPATLWSVLELLQPHSWSLPARPQQITRPETLRIQHWT